MPHDITNAEKKPWYLLATAHGPQEQLHQFHANENAAIWNGWLAQNTTYEKDFPLTEEGLRVIEKRFEDAGLTKADIPAPNGVINLDNTHFSNAFNIEGFKFIGQILCARNCIFDGHAKFSGAEIRSIDFTRTQFKGNAYFQDVKLGYGFSGISSNFCDAVFEGDAVFTKAEIHNASFHSAHFLKATNFLGASFKGTPPSFHGVETGGDVRLTLEYTNWPDPNNLSDEKAQNFRHIWLTNYQSAQRLASDLHLLEETNFFVRQEFRCRTAFQKQSPTIPVWKVFGFWLFTWPPVFLFDSYLANRHSYKHVSSVRLRTKQQ